MIRPREAAKENVGNAGMGNGERWFKSIVQGIVTGIVAGITAVVTVGAIIGGVVNSALNDL